MPCLLLALITLMVSPPSARAQELIARDVPLVLTQVPRAVQKPQAGWHEDGLARADWFAGARIVAVSPEGQVRVLSDGFASACDPDVSFDGQRVVFAGKKDGQSHWRIWEVGIDGHGLRPVSSETQDARSPIYVSTLFTLDSPEPWYTLVYVGRESIINEIGQPLASSLYNIKLDGTEVRRLTFTPNQNLDPVQTKDGRVIYAAVYYPQEPGPVDGRLGLFGIHMVGTDGELYGGGSGRRIQHMPCATEDSRIVFVESDAATWDGAGQLSCVHQRRPHHTYKRLTSEPSFLFLYPTPWRDQQILVSRRRADGQDTCGVFCYDPAQGRCEAVFDSAEYHDVQAKPVRPRRPPDGHSTIVEPAKYTTGVFYGLNCYTADARLAPHLAPGTFKRLRVIEGVPQLADRVPPRSADGLAFTGPYVPRRLIGEGPIEADGSFNVEVPADVPILLQALDERGMALATCGWIWVKQRETRACIGCHEDPELTPENDYVQALRRPSNRLVLPPDARRNIAFRETIVPILQNRCASAACHGGPNTPLSLPLQAERPSPADIQKAYAALLAPEDPNAADSGSHLRRGKYIDAGRARSSYLAWQLVGTNTARPWDHKEGTAHAMSRRIIPMPPPGKSIPLTPEQLRTLIQWIDLGAPYQAIEATETATASPQTHAP